MPLPNVKETAPVITKTLFNTFDVAYIFRKGSNLKPMVKSFGTMHDAQAFAENQHVIVYYKKIDSYLDSLTYLRNSYSDTYANFAPHINNIRTLLNEITPLTNRAAFIDILENGLMANLYQLTGRTGTRTHSHAQCILGQLKDFVKVYKVTTTTEPLDFTKKHELNSLFEVSKV